MFDRSEVDLAYMLYFHYIFGSCAFMPPKSNRCPKLGTE